MRTSAFKYRGIIGVVLLPMTLLAQTSDTIQASKFNSSKNSNSQTIVTEKVFKGFLGIWQYQTSDQKVFLRLKTKTVKLNDDGPAFELLTGGYRYFKGSVSIYDTYDIDLISAKADGSSINQILLMLMDSKTLKCSVFIARLIDRNTMILKASDLRGEGIIYNKKLDFLDNLTLKRF